MTLDLDELERLARAASPTPWHIHANTEVESATAGEHIACCDGCTNAGDENNAALIVAAVTALGPLCARVRELEAQRDGLLQQIHDKGGYVERIRELEGDAAVYVARVLDAADAWADPRTRHFGHTEALINAVRAWRKATGADRE